MKATELRLGNLVYYHIKDEMDERVEWDEINHIDVDDLRILTDFENNSEYKPIPLTEEWLLKFGFDKSIKISYSTGVEVTFNFYEKSILTYNSIQNCWRINDLILYMQPEYVHELQNLYFMLAGEELTI